MRLSKFWSFGCLLKAFVLSLVLACSSNLPVLAKGLWSDTSDVVALSALPQKAQTVYALIHQGGPFEFEKDGVVFGNRERLLPKQPRGYYREYTVKTPGERSRGARRIVCGGLQAPQPAVCYYTDDHYNSFRRIVP